MQNKLIFLGTGTSQGIPMIGCRCSVCTSPDPRDKRLRSSVYVEYEGLKLLIDAGPDFRQQILREDITYLDAVLLTHQHKDHTGGLDDVRAFNYLYDKDFPIYAEERVQASLKQEYAYAFSEFRYPGVPQFELHSIDEHPFSIQGVEIVPIRAWHHKLPILGFRLGKLAYLTDANRIDPQEIKKMEGVEVLIINTIRHTPHLSHFSLPEALAVIEQVGASRNYLTHLSHQIDAHAQLEQLLPKIVQPAYDRLTIEF